MIMQTVLAEQSVCTVMILMDSWGKRHTYCLFTAPLFHATVLLSCIVANVRLVVPILHVSLTHLYIWALVLNEACCPVTADCENRWDG